MQEIFNILYSRLGCSQRRLLSVDGTLDLVKFRPNVGNSIVEDLIGAVIVRNRLALMVSWIADFLNVNRVQLHLHRRLLIAGLFV